MILVSSIFSGRPKSRLHNSLSPGDQDFPDLEKKLKKVRLKSLIGSLILIVITILAVYLY